jgi:hypothetical protein
MCVKYHGMASGKMFRHQQGAFSTAIFWRRASFGVALATVYSKVLFQTGQMFATVLHKAGEGCLLGCSDFDFFSHFEV